MLTEYIAHRLIGTALERPARGIRSNLRFLGRPPGPEWAELCGEDECIESAVRYLVRDGVNCIDIGSHLGAMTARMRRLSPHGRHMAFEPTPYKARWLRARFPGIEVCEMALSDSEGEAEFFHRPRQSGFNGLRLHKHGEDTGGVERFKVRVARLDDLVPESRRIGFVKVDVEGGEWDVFRGASALLDRDRPAILFECTLSGLDAFGRAPADMYDLLTVRHGYRVYLVGEWLATAPALPFGAFVQAMQYPARAFNFLATHPDNPATEPPATGTATK